MKCPHCLTDFHDAERLVFKEADPEGIWAVTRRECSYCKKIILQVVCAAKNVWQIDEWKVGVSEEKRRYYARPKVANRAPPSRDVPKEYADDYLEACLVLADSPKASAALSRRCVQHLLREVAKVKKGDLSGEIQELIDRGTLPSHLSESLDAIRNIGNFAAHPIKTKSAGEIVEVEEGEAEWSLDTLEGLFDYYFVQPAVVKRKRDALNQKLASAGKPPLK